MRCYASSSTVAPLASTSFLPPSFPTGTPLPSDVGRAWRCVPGRTKATGVDSWPCGPGVWFVEKGTENGEK